MADTTNRGLGSDNMDEETKQDIQRKGGQSTNDQNQKGGQSSSQTQDDTGFTTTDDDLDQGI